MTDLSQGLMLSLWGVGITFLALGMLIFIILILRWIYPPEKNPFAADESEEKRHELAAAIAVAVSLLESGESDLAKLGEVLEKPRSRWWQSKRL